MRKISLMAFVKDSVNLGPTEWDKLPHDKACLQAYIYSPLKLDLPATKIYPFKKRCRYPMRDSLAVSKL